MSTTPHDRDGNALEPGALYAAFVDADWPGDPPSVVAYVYWTGSELVHDDGDSDALDANFDFLVRQAGGINATIIDDDDTQEALAESRATRGDW